MNPTLTPDSPDELVEMVRATPRLIAVGAGTKPRLSATGATGLSTTKLRGVVEYEPDEFIITAGAGTPMREIAELLASQGQYLPFDPMLLEAGATLGGTVASGVSGPGRFRFGGVRDFILGIRFVDGAGRLLRLGGKVVKNAAGFDLPKFFVGSLGRFGVLAEVTLKVFPLPPASLSIRLDMDDPKAAIRLLADAANNRWELDALDWLPGQQAVLLRVNGPAGALEPLADEILQRWPGRILTNTQASTAWEDLREFRWVGPEGIMIKIPLTPAALTDFPMILHGGDQMPAHISAGGDVAYVSLPDAAQSAALSEQLAARNLSGICLKGDAPLWLGARHHSRIALDVKTALDPDNRFPALHD